MSKSKVNLLIAQQNPWNEERPLCAKKYVNGVSEPIQHPTKWKIKPIHFETLTQLLEKIRPYIEGTHPESNYASLYYGDINEDYIEPDGTFARKGATIRMPRDYLILDIETQKTDYENISTDLKAIHKWLIDTYDFIDEDSGILLHHSGSAGVKVGQKHKQIRVRAILKIKYFAEQNERKRFLRYYKNNGKKDFHNHIDFVSTNDTQLFYLSPPILEDTSHIEIKSSDRWFLHEGKPISIDKMTSTSSDVSSPKKSGHHHTDFVGVPSATKKLMSKSIKEWFAEIGTMDTWEVMFWYLWRCEIEGKTDQGIKNLLEHPHLKNHPDNKGELSYIKGVLEYIRDNIHYDYSIPFEPGERHNIIQVNEALLKNWNGEIDYTCEDTKVILGKLYEGAGKTQSLKPLFEQDKRILYIAPKISPVEAFCKELGIPHYREERFKDEDSDDELFKEKQLGICYNSLPKLTFRSKAGKHIPKYDIVIVDEIEELLAQSVSEIVENKADTNDVFIKLLAESKLLVGLDARISNLSLYCIEKLRNEDFDIYTHETVKPFIDHHFTFKNSLAEGIEDVVRFVNEGKKVAITSELKGDRTKELNLEALKEYVEQRTQKKGISIWRDDKHEHEKNLILTDLSNSKSKHHGTLEQYLTSDKIFHLWLSPITQSSWNYLALDEDKGAFDVVFGLYPSPGGNALLNAPNIIQHMKRFRQTKEFIMFVQESGMSWDNSASIFKSLNPEYKYFNPSDLRTNYSKIETNELDSRARTVLINDKVSLNHRGKHLRQMIDLRGGTIHDEEHDTEKSGFRTVLSKQYKELKELMHTDFIWEMAEVLYEQQTKTGKVNDLGEEITEQVNPEATYLNLKFKENKTLEDYALIFVYEIRYSKNWGYVVKDNKSDEELDKIFDHFFISDRHRTKENRDIFEMSSEKREQEDDVRVLANRKHLVKRGQLIDECCRLLGIKRYNGFKLEEKVITKQEILDSNWFELVIKYWQNIGTLYGINVPVKSSFRENPTTFFRLFAKQVLGILLEKTNARGGASKHWDRLFAEHKKKDIYKRKHPHGLGLPKMPSNIGAKKGASREWIINTPWERRTDIEKTYSKDSFEGIFVNANQPRWLGYSQKNGLNDGNDIPIDVERRVFK